MCLLAISSGVDVAAIAVGGIGGGGVSDSRGVNVDVTAVRGRAGGGGVSYSRGVDVDATTVKGRAGVAVGSDVDDVVSSAAIVAEVVVVDALRRNGATAPLATAGGEVSLGSTPSGSSAAGSGGVGMEAWFQAAAASVDISETFGERANYSLEVLKLVLHPTATF